MKNFGTHDKQVLLANALVVALLLSVVAGIGAVRGKQWGTWLVLALGAERYGVDILQVQTIQALTGLAPVPGLPAF